MLKPIENSDKLNIPSLSANVTKWVGIITLCTSLVLSANQKALGSLTDPAIDNNRGNDTTEVFKNDIRTKITLNLNGLVKAIEVKHPELKFSPELNYHNGILLRILGYNIERNKLDVTFNLSPENVKQLEATMESVAYLLDNLYYKGYADVLKNGDVNKDLLIGLIKDGYDYKINNISIEGGTVDIPEDDVEYKAHGNSKMYGE